MEDVGELVLIALPLMSHLVPQVELARQLVAHHPGISIALIIPKLPIPDDTLDAYLRSAPLVSDRVSFIELSPPEDAPLTPEWISQRMFVLCNHLTTVYKAVVKRVISTRQRRTIGIVTDMFLVHFEDVAEELRVPFYVSFPSGANTLALMFRLESIGVDAPSEFGNLPPESAPLEIPGFRNPVPLKVWPDVILNKEFFPQFLNLPTTYRRTKGILVNTFTELDSEFLLPLAEDERIPPVYSVGPNVRMGHRPVVDGEDQIFNWLDSQPPGSVVFICFETAGSFGKQQLEQIGIGIERSGHRFLWYLRLPTEVLPAGFLERTAGLGKVTGWAPQADVLAHPAVGAFASNCGWTSSLESLLFGVPVVAWPMYATQHLNAFTLVREFGLAVELSMDYRYNKNMVVTAAEVEMGIRKMMEEEEGARVRKKAKEMGQLARKALDVGGSSSKSLDLFIQDLLKNFN